MAYKYFDKNNKEIKHSNPLEAAEDLNVIKFVSTGEPKSESYIRTGAGWLPESDVQGKSSFIDRSQQ
ncbi:hypothetical protein [Paucilactobacillus sp. N302-9]